MAEGLRDKETLARSGVCHAATGHRLPVVARGTVTAAANLNHPKCEPVMKRATASGLPGCMLWTAFCCSLLIVISSMPRYIFLAWGEELLALLR